MSAERVFIRGTFKHVIVKCSSQCHMEVTQNLRRVMSGTLSFEGIGKHWALGTLCFCKGNPKQKVVEKSILQKENTRCVFMCACV